MSLVTRFADFILSVAADIKSLRGQVSDAGTWPIVFDDPPQQEPGRPWLLLGVSADYVPLGVRCGFNRTSIPPDPSTIVAQLSVMTTEGVVVRFSPSAVS